MIHVARIDRTTFETPDLTRQVEYYSRVMGLHVLSQTAEHAFLGSPTGGEVIGFENGSSNRCRTVTFQVAPGADFQHIGQELGKSGIKHDMRSDISPHISKAIAFAGPHGTGIELFAEHTAISIPRSHGGIEPLKLGHVAFSVPNAQAVVDFYVNTLDFRVSDWIEDIFAFLRCGPDHHSVNFLNGPSTFMHHIAYELKDWAHVLSACEILGREKQPIIGGPGCHRVGHNIFVFFRDPDDNIIELYTELDLMKDEALGYFEPRPWHKTNPQRPTVWSRPDSAPVWGMAPSPDFRRSGNSHLNR